MSARAFVTLSVVAVVVSCNRGGSDTKDGIGSISAVGQSVSPQGPLVDSIKASLQLKIYPDMAMPGKEVVVEVSVVPLPVGEVPEVRFAAIKDPCDGELVQEGPKVTYLVPQDCRGSGILIRVLVKGSFGVLSQDIPIDIKKTSFMDSVVYNYPLPGQRLSSPISVWWDRSLYHNREEKLSFKVKRRDQTILDTGLLEPGEVIELDIPPSPDEVVLFGETTTGSAETALLRVHRRQVPEWRSNVLMLDSFVLPDQNALGAPREVLDEGGTVEIGLGRRIHLDGGERSFLFMDYHVKKSKRYGRDEALMGFSEKIPVTATVGEYKQLQVWLKGDAVRGTATPIYVRLSGSRGSKRTFAIKKIRDTWQPYHFPLARALRKKGERLRRVSIFLDAKDVTPPLGMLLFGGLYLEPHARKKEE